MNRFFPQKQHTDGQTHEKMFKATNQGKANQDHNEITPHTCQNGYDEKDNKEQAVQKMYRTRNPHVLLWD